MFSKYLGLETRSGTCRTLHGVELSEPYGSPFVFGGTRARLDM